MSSTALTATRRGAVKRGLLLVAGAVGFGAAAGRGEAAPAANPLPSGPRSTERLTLQGRNWRLSAPSRAHGRLPDGGEPAATHGDLVDGAGRRIGSFRSASLDGALARFQLHTFELPDGTIMGLGSGGLDDASFAVIGGTGRYAGLGGAYVARQRPREVGGNGTAEFILTLNAREA